MTYKLLWLFLSIAPVITAASRIETPVRPHRTSSVETPFSPVTAYFDSDSGIFRWKNLPLASTPDLCLPEAYTSARAWCRISGHEARHTKPNQGSVCDFTCQGYGYEKLETSDEGAFPCPDEKCRYHKYRAAFWHYGALKQHLSDVHKKDLSDFDAIILIARRAAYK